MAGGVTHTVALKADGNLWASGANAVGQLGDGTTTDRWSPVLVFKANKRPVLSASKGSYWLSFKHTGAIVAKTFINARIRVRDGSGGYHKIRVREQQPASGWTHYRVYWRHAPRYYGLTARYYSLKWPAPRTFWGGGIYKIQIKVRDREGNWSNAVYHQWNIGD